MPGDVSPEMQAVIGNPFRANFWYVDPKTPEEWKKFVAYWAGVAIPPLAGIRDKLGVTMQETTIDGVHAYILQPKTLPAVNANRLLVHVHGGGYTNSPGEAATGEAALMAGYGGYKVISVDYRMPPDHPYPAALDDAMTVYRAALKMQKPANIAVFGLSTGGGLTLAMMLRAKAEGLPMPAAIGPGTPWSDLTETGDSYRTNQFVDNVLVAYHGWLEHAAALYAAGHDLKDPMLSPTVATCTASRRPILSTGTRTCSCPTQSGWIRSCVSRASRPSCWFTRASPTASSTPHRFRRKPRITTRRWRSSSTRISGGNLRGFRCYDDCVRRSSKSEGGSNPVLLKP